MTKSFSQILIISILLLLIFLFVDSVSSTKFNSPIIILSFLINGIISIFFLSSSLSKDGISLQVIFWFFNSLFLFLIPLTQYLTGFWLFLDKFDDIFYANMLILFWLILFKLGYKYGCLISRKRFILFSKSKEAYIYTITRNKLWSLLFLMVIVAIYLIRVSGFNSLFLRGQAGVVNALGGWGPLGLIGEYYLRPLPLFLFLFSIYYVKSIKLVTINEYILIFISGLITLLLNFPTATARFYVFTVYLGIIVYFIKPDHKKAFFYLSLLVISLLGSNILDAFRYSDKFSLTNLSIKFNIASFFVGHFDAYENFVHTIQYVELNGITWGNQLLGVLLFWMPRSIWINKPIGTGAFIAQEHLSKYYIVYNDNLSAPFIEEMYINFHVLGVLFGTFMFGILLGLIDYGYRLSNLNSRFAQVKPMYALLYPVLLGLLLFLLRGDALSSFAYSSGMIAAYATIRAFLVKRSVITNFVR